MNLLLKIQQPLKLCDEFYNRYPNHKGKIIINGDASGDNRSCMSEYTNYVIIKKSLNLSVIMSKLESRHLILQ